MNILKLFNLGSSGDSDADIPSSPPPSRHKKSSILRESFASLTGVEDLALLDLDQCTGKWTRVDNLTFDDFDPKRGTTNNYGRVAVQHDALGNSLVPFRCSSAMIDLEAITVFKLYAPSRLEDRLSVGIVNDKYSINGTYPELRQALASRMVCNGSTGVGVVINADDFSVPTTNVRASTAAADRVPVVVQIDGFHREMVIYRESAAAKEFTPTPPPSKSRLSARFGAPNSSQLKQVGRSRFFDEDRDTLVARVRFPVHWEETYFAVDLYGRGDEVRVDVAYKWHIVKRKRPKRTDTAISTRQRRMLEALFAAPESEGDKDGQSAQDRSNNKNNARDASNTKNPRDKTKQKSPRKQEWRVNWQNGYVPLLDSSLLVAMIANKKGASKRLPSLRQAANFQTWMYKTAASAKPGVKGHGMRESLLPLGEASVKPRSERGVSLMLLRDLYEQCGQFAMDRKTTVRQVVPQLLAWSDGYGCSVAEVLGATPAYITSSTLLQGSPFESHLHAPTATKSKKSQRAVAQNYYYQQYVFAEVKPADHYVSFTWDLPWFQLIGNVLPNTIPNYNTEMAFWFDFLGEDYYKMIVQKPAPRRARAQTLKSTRERAASRTTRTRGLSMQSAGRASGTSASSGDSGATDAENHLANTEALIQNIGSMVVVVDRAGYCFTRLWCLYEIVTCLASGGILMVGLVSNSHHESCALAILVAAGRFDGCIDVASATSNAPREVSRQLRQRMRAKYDGDEKVNRTIEEALRSSAKTYLFENTRGFSSEDIDKAVAYARRLDPKGFIVQLPPTPPGGKPPSSTAFADLTVQDGARWKKLVRFLFPKR